MPITRPTVVPPAPVPPADSYNGPWRAGKLLVVRAGAPLPLRCIRCDADVTAADVPVRLVWSPHARAGGRSLVRKGTFLATARRATLRVGLCDRCRAHRRRVLGGWVAVMVIGAAAFGTVVVLSEAGRVYRQDPWAVGVALTGLLMAMGPLWLIALALPLLKPERIDDGRVVARGAGAEFLDRLPDLPG